MNLASASCPNGCARPPERPGRRLRCRSLFGTVEQLIGVALVHGLGEINRRVEARRIYILTTGLDLKYHFAPHAPGDVVPVAPNFWTALRDTQDGRTDERRP